MGRDRVKRRDSVLKRDVSGRVMGTETERERVTNIIELKRWSRAISKQVGVWREKERV